MSYMNKSILEILSYIKDDPRTYYFEEHPSFQRLLLYNAPINTRFYAATSIRKKVTKRTYIFEVLKKTTINPPTSWNLSVFFDDVLRSVDHVRFPTIRKKLTAHAGWKVLYNLTKRKTK